MIRKLVLIVGFVVTFLIGIVVGTTLVGIINISYIIEPTTSEAVTLNPNPVSLDLGTIPSASVGKIDFGNCCRLSLSAGYVIGFELDETTIQDFDSLEARLRFHEVGTTYVHYLYLGWQLDYVGSITLDAGDYDIHIEIEYNAPHVTEATTGEVKIMISY